ncbi:hypothetical protein EW145_g4224 [Phellinidium pouzarii]|uniref:Ferritin-like domain-containing protein n=1 Tax=Phellinidium pouzarii TaxID=167371 RepID=A0A4S4L496_9AGAM|nr:hypothetical protein EW145_g4224 [Phellinidium pouzarii]
MKSSLILATTLLAAAPNVLCNPIARAFNTTFSNATNSTTANATQILQFALTLEHLENAFYSQGLSNFSESDFENAGLPSSARGRFEQIAQHESTHVDFLTNALGNDSVAACNYSFPSTDPNSFAALSGILESVGNAAYLGAAVDLTNDTTALKAAASILSTEARHASWVYSSVLGSDPWSGAFDTPLDGDLVYTLASSFIVSCPESNPALPFTAFPSLNVSGSGNSSFGNSSSGNSSVNSTYAPAPGNNVTLSYDNSTAGENAQFLAFLSGLNTTFANISSDKQVAIPNNLQGLVFAVVTTNDTSVSNGSIVAGPATLFFPFSPNSTNANVTDM